MLLVYPNFGTISSRLYQSRQVQQVQEGFIKELEWLESFDSVSCVSTKTMQAKRQRVSVLDCSPLTKLRYVRCH